MKTVLEYLEECKERAYENLHCYSIDYAMTKPNGEYENEFREAKKDIEIVEELFSMVENTQSSNPEICSSQGLREVMLAFQQRPRITSQYGRIDMLDSLCRVANQKNEALKKQEPHYNNRKNVIDKIVKLIIAELQEPNKGKLTSRYVIGLLKEAITSLESSALMKPPRY